LIDGAVGASLVAVLISGFLCHALMFHFSEEEGERRAGAIGRNLAA
jgi:hypothetical protein